MTMMIWYDTEERERTNTKMLCLGWGGLEREFDVAYPEAGKSLFVLDRFSVSLSALLLEAIFHDALGMLDDGGLNLDLGGWDDGIPTEGVFA